MPSITRLDSVPMTPLPAMVLSTTMVLDTDTNAPAHKASTPKNPIMSARPAPKAMLRVIWIAVPSRATRRIERSASNENSIPIDDEAYVRRVTLDLTGLQPTLDEREAFLADAESACALAQRFGERLIDLVGWVDDRHESPPVGTLCGAEVRDMPAGPGSARGRRWRDGGMP